MLCLIETILPLSRWDTLRPVPLGQTPILIQIPDFGQLGQV